MVSNSNVAKVYFAQVRKADGDLEHARKVADAIRGFPENLSVKYNRERTLAGIKAENLDFTDDSQTVDRVHIEDVIDRLMENAPSGRFRRKVKTEQISESDSVRSDGWFPELTGTGCRWNGQEYHPEWYKKY